ncbi:MAG: helix-turn-helix domain-containing protein [Sarcina sp.]
MDTIQLLQQALDYIEENLTTEIFIDEVAKVIGFSTYHFSHLFSDIVGIPVSAYITKRRVRHAIYEISKSGKMVDITLAYGFDTYAGFYKAFKREFGCSPSKFLKINTARKPQAVNLSEEAKKMLTNKQVKEHLSNWELDTELKINPTFIVGGTIQASNVWDINNKYIFKIGKDIAGLRGEIALTKELKKVGLKAKYPIQTKGGEDFIIIDDRFYIVTNKIEGHITSSEERYGENRTKIAREYGGAIGKLHKGLIKVEEALDIDDTNMLSVVVDYAMPKTKQVMEQWGCPLPEEFYNEYIEEFSKLYEKLPKQLIHRDANPSNIIYDKEQVTGFVDFDLNERNVRLFDPCYCATGILSEVGENKEGFEKWPEILNGIIKGYDEIMELTEEEKQAIPYVIYSIQIIFIAWLIDNEKYKDCALQNRKMLVWMWENRENLF